MITFPNNINVKLWAITAVVRECPICIEIPPNGLAVKTAWLGGKKLGARCHRLKFIPLLVKAFCHIPSR